MKRILILISIILLALTLNAQDWERRHLFARSYFGISNNIVPNFDDGSYLNSNNIIQRFERSGFFSPSINIGATHFWGYADLYISISTVAIKFDKDKVKNTLRLGTFTGIRVYPLKIKDYGIRPYLGYKFTPFTYRQGDINVNDFEISKVKSIFDFGMGFQLPNFYFTVEYNRVATSEYTSYLSRDQYTNSQFPKSFFQLGINYMIETTKNANKSINKKLNKQFSKSNRDGLFLGGGPSSAFPIVSSSYIKELYPFLDDKSLPIIFPDFVVGYHFTKTDLVTAISFRSINQQRNAFGFKQTINRKSIILETYKFFGDYHGFVPYLGLGISYENLKLLEFDNDVNITKLTTNQVSPAVVFGWDIRPSEKGDWWILRTNFRYFPFLNIEKENKKLSLQHLEFNFIQFIFYPQRLKLTKESN